MQAPAVQAGWVLGRAAQAMPQAPQCITLVAVEVSQPLLGSLSQSPKLPVHMPTAQRPIAHDGAALAGAHTAPQPPQWSVLAAVSTQPPLQHARPAAQGWASLQPGTHSLPRQRVPGAQWLSAVQATQRRVVVSQRGIAAPASAPDAAQAMSSRQPAVQRRAIGSQYSPVGQRSLVGVHATQRPVAVSQAVRPSSLPAAVVVAAAEGRARVGGHVDAGVARPRVEAHVHRHVHGGHVDAQVGRAAVFGAAHHRVARTPQEHDGPTHHPPRRKSHGHDGFTARGDRQASQRRASAMSASASSSRVGAGQRDAASTARKARWLSRAARR